ncbi:MAG: hypothetical protein ABW328_10640 [Ilumatobacteraceae bacterium]
MGAGRLDARDERPHDGAAAEEWVFTTWLADGSLGVVSGYRRNTVGGGWYWAAVARSGHRLLHVTEWHVPTRPDPLLVKAHGLWAEHVCDSPMEQWTVSNETYAVALDDPEDALGRAFGQPSAVACDLEWYATARPSAAPDGYAQDGVVHGIVELTGGAVELAETPARRWHRWGGSLGPIVLPDAYAHTGVRAPFAFPDGAVADWVLTPDGWRARAPAPSHRRVPGPSS